MKKKGDLKGLVRGTHVKKSPGTGGEKRGGKRVGVSGAIRERKDNFCRGVMCSWVGTEQIGTLFSKGKGNAGGGGIVLPKLQNA